MACRRSGMTHVAMHRRSAWHSALRRYIGVIALGNLAWEFVQLPFYTIWRTGTLGEIVFAVVHCTGGDILIALSSLAVALLAVGSGEWPEERFRAIAALTIILGIAYTIFSEYLNIVIRAAWAYSDMMPVFSVFGFRVGASPLLQWIAVPLAAFAWAGRVRALRHGRTSYSDSDAQRGS